MGKRLQLNRHGPHRYQAVQRHLLGFQICYKALKTNRRFVRRRPGKTKVTHLTEDLQYRRLKETRFLHKVLVWPTFDWDPRKPRKPNPLKEFRDLPREYGMRYVRARLVQKARALGCNLGASKKFNAAAEMKRNFLTVFHLDEFDCDLAEQLRACDVNFVSKDGRHTIDFETEWKSLIIGDVVRDGRNKPWVQITDATTGKTRLYDFKHTWPRITPRTWKIECERSWLLPAWVDRKLGMHNGSAQPASYMNVSSKGLPRAVHTQLQEIKALEKRETAFKALLRELFPRSANCTGWGDVFACESFCKGQNLASPSSKQLWEVMNGIEMLWTYLEDEKSDSGRIWKMKRTYPPELRIILAECTHNRDIILF